MYVHCNKCHHEWECADIDDQKCDWCNGGCFILEEKTPLQIMMANINRVIRKDNKYVNRNKVEIND